MKKHFLKYQLEGYLFLNSKIPFKEDLVVSLSQVVCE